MIKTSLLLLIVAPHFEWQINVAYANNLDMVIISICGALLFTYVYFCFKHFDITKYFKTEKLKDIMLKEKGINAEKSKKCKC